MPSNSVCNIFDKSNPGDLHFEFANLFSRLLCVGELFVIVSRHGTNGIVFLLLGEWGGHGGGGGGGGKVCGGFLFCVSTEPSVANFGSGCSCGACG